MSTNAQTDTTTRLLYFFDPLCGWCYGFSPVIRSLAAQQDTLPVEVMCGGMITGEREGPLGKQMADYILGVVPRLEGMTGVKFGEKYLDMIRDGSHYNSSVKPSIAVVIMKELHPDRALLFAADLQKISFSEGFDFNEDSTYREMAQRYALDVKDFMRRMADPVYKAKAESEFDLTKRFGITGFPCVVAQHKGQFFMVSSGFTPENELKATLQRIMAE